MRQDFYFDDLYDYINLIFIESRVEIGPRKLESAQILLKNLQFIDKKIDQSWEISMLEDKHIHFFSLRVGTYINHQKKTIVIALSGTKNSHDIKPDLEILSGKVPARFQKFSDYLNKYLKNLNIQTYRKKGYKIIFTGHSLGGFLAQLGYIYFKVENPEFQALVITFDSPGAKTHALKLLTNKFLINNTLNKAKILASQVLETIDCSENMINIIRRLNIINTSGKQIGSYYLLIESYVKLESCNHLTLWKNLSFHKLSSFMSAIKNFKVYHIYQLDKPTLSGARLIHSAELNAKSILSNIQELQQQKLPEKVFSNYLLIILEPIPQIYPNESEFERLQILDELNKIANQNMQLMKKRNFFTKFKDFCKSIQGQMKSYEIFQNNLLIINNIISNLQTNNVEIPLYSLSVNNNTSPNQYSKNRFR